MCFWLPLGQTDRNTCVVSVTNLFFNFVKNKLSYNGFITDFFAILPVFDQFKHEANRVLSIIESQLGLRPVGDMKAKLGPCLGVTGSLTGSVVPT
jgi:hypothetical protein